MHEDIQTKWGRLHIVHIRAEPFETCPHETDPYFDFEPEVSAFVNIAAEA